MTKHWFLPQNPDVLQTLREQADITLAGASAFAAWAGGEIRLSSGGIVFFRGLATM